MPDRVPCGHLARRSFPLPDLQEQPLSPRIDPYSLRLFIAAARAGSIMRASEHEHIASSALSRRLADLEHAFGTALLVRSARGVSLTDAGRLVFDHGVRMDEELQDDRADLGVGVDNSLPNGLESWHFADDPMQVVLPTRHALEARDAIAFAQSWSTR